MDGGGRFAQSLTRAMRRGPLRCARLASRSLRRLARSRSAFACAAVLLFAGLGYGGWRTWHSGVVIAAVHDARDRLANAAGFRIADVAIGGNRQVSREEILATAGVTGHTSLLFFDVDEARRKLRGNPWIADATVLKLYPDRLQVSITERAPFALWQFQHKVSVIADDGTVLEPYVARRFTGLPFVVGRGAGTRAKSFLALLDRYPAIAQEVRAAVMVAERRWNLILRTGLEVKLPERNLAPALARLIALDRDKKVLSRDITVLDLRFADRVVVRLSDEAFKAREETLKAEEKKAKHKGGSA